jgi:hypothetical protein
MDYYILVEIMTNAVFTKGQCSLYSKLFIIMHNSASRVPGTIRRDENLKKE